MLLVRTRTGTRGGWIERRRGGVQRHCVGESQECAEVGPCAATTLSAFPQIFQRWNAPLSDA
eukprot:1851202-Rhodomonas_salina.1